jgi:hypothetical protein
MKSKIVKKEEKAINWNESQICKIVHEDNKCIYVLSTGDHNDLTFEGVIIASETNYYLVGSLYSKLNKNLFSLVQGDLTITFNN